MTERVEISVEGTDKLTAPMAKARSSLDRLDKASRNLQRALKDTASTMSSLGTKMSLAITLPIVAMGTAFAKAAMDAVESENLFEVSMGGMAAAARQWSQEFSASLGLNEYAIRKQTATFNVMLGSMGLGEKAAYDMARGLTSLSYDMASFYNLRPDEAFEKLQAGISGEIEPLKRLGIVINETMVEQYALNQGWLQQGQQLSEQGKILSRYGLILEGTSAAQGDLARTMDSPTNQLRIMQAQFERLSVEIGQQFLPTISQALMWINNDGMPMVRVALANMQTAWAEMSDEAKHRVLLVAGLFVAGGPLLKALAIAIQGVGLLVSAFALLPGKVKVAVAAATAAILLFHEQIGEMIRKTGQDLENLSGQLGFEWLDKNVGRDLRTFGENLKNVGKDGLSVGKVVETIAGALDDPFTALAGQLAEKGGELFGDFTQGWEDAVAARKMGPRLSDLIPEALPAAAQAAQQYGQSMVEANEKAEKGSKKAAESVRGTGAAMRDVRGEIASVLGGLQPLVDEMISMEPASVEAAAGVDALKTELLSLNAAQIASQVSIRAAQDAMRGMQERVSAISDELSKARQRLDEFTRPTLTGMTAIDDKMFAVEQQIKRLKAAQMGVDISKFMPIDPAMRGYVATLPKDIEELQKVLEKLNLTRSLTYDEQLRAIEKAAKGPIKEIGYQAAIVGIVGTKNAIAGLENSLQGANAAVKAQERAIRGLEDAARLLAEQTQIVQEQLRLQEEKQTFVNKALEIAYKWFIEDRRKLEELGDAGQHMVEVLDPMVRTYLDNLNMYATQQSAIAIKNIKDLIDAYNRARAAMAAGLPGNAWIAPPPPPPSAPTDWIPTPPGEPEPEEPPEFAHGVRRFRGGRAIVGEQGPELVSLAAGSNVTPLMAFDYEQMAAAQARHPIILQIDGEEIVVRGLERAKARGRV